MMMLGTSVRRRKAHEPKPLLAKEGICGTCREGRKRWAIRARQAPSWGCLPLGRQVAQKRKLLLCPEAEGAPRKASLGLLGPPEALPLLSLERGLEPPAQRFRNAALLGWLVLWFTGVTTHFNVQAPSGNSLREVLPRYEAAKRWVSYYWVQGRLSRLPRM
jgi:hypothetical protein